MERWREVSADDEAPRRCHAHEVVMGGGGWVGAEPSHGGEKAGGAAIEESQHSTCTKGPSQSLATHARTMYIHTRNYIYSI